MAKMSASASACAFSASPTAPRKSTRSVTPTDAASAASRAWSAPAPISSKRAPGSAGSAAITRSKPLRGSSRPMPRMRRPGGVPRAAGGGGASGRFTTVTCGCSPASSPAV